MGNREKQLLKMLGRRSAQNKRKAAKLSTWPRESQVSDDVQRRRIPVLLTENSAKESFALKRGVVLLRNPVRVGGTLSRSLEIGKFTAVKS